MQNSVQEVKEIGKKVKKHGKQRWSNLSRTWPLKGRDRENGTEETFDEIMTEKFSELMKVTNCCP